MAAEGSDGLVQNCGALLRKYWENSLISQTSPILEPPKLCQLISDSVNSKTISYRYVLPTQLIAKVANSSLDCRCIQVSRRGTGNFDARSICKKVIVPFDKDNEEVLGGSPEPYVNNPLRVPEISSSHRSGQKDKDGWDKLCVLLETVERKNDPEFTESMLKKTLAEIYKRLSQTKVTYPIPRRVSLGQVLALIAQFQSIPSGGDHLLAVTAALMEIAGKKFGLWTTAKRSMINASDRASGNIADIECRDAKGNIVLPLEVKARQLKESDIAEKLSMIKTRSIVEFIFLSDGIVPTDTTKINQMIANEFAAGYNIHVMDFRVLARAILTLISECDRRDLLLYVGKQLDTYSDISSRRKWAELLAKLTSLTTS